MAQISNPTQDAVITKNINLMRGFISSEIFLLKLLNANPAKKAAIPYLIHLKLNCIKKQNSSVLSSEYLRFGFEIL